MITVEERREVARRLRESAENGEVLRDVFLEEILAGDIGLWFAEDIEIDILLYHLADLIEPPTQCPYYHNDRHHCSAYDDVVDRDALLALADNLDSSASTLLKQNDLDPNRKRRGMRRDHAQSLMAASGCIREALGMEDHASHDDESAQR